MKITSFLLFSFFPMATGYSVVAPGGAAPSLKPALLRVSSKTTRVDSDHDSKSTAFEQKIKPMTISNEEKELDSRRAVYELFLTHSRGLGEGGGAKSSMSYLPTLSMSYYLPAFSMSFPVDTMSMSFPSGDDDDDDDDDSGTCPTTGIQSSRAEKNDLHNKNTCPAGAVKCRGRTGSGSYMNEFANPPFTQGTTLQCLPEGETQEVSVNVVGVQTKSGGEEVGLDLQVVGGLFKFAVVYMKGGPDGGNWIYWDDNGTPGGSPAGSFLTLGNKGISHVDICLFPCSPASPASSLIEETISDTPPDSTGSSAASTGEGDESVSELKEGPSIDGEPTQEGLSASTKGAVIGVVGLASAFVVVGFLMAESKRRTVAAAAAMNASVFSADASSVV